MQVILIGVGGFAGAVARFGLSGWVQRLVGSAFPWATLAVNAIGSFVLAIVLTSLGERLIPSELARTAVTVGFLGAFTTFSTFAYESVKLVEEGALILAGLNVTASALTCLAGVYAGLWLGRAAA